MYTYVNILYSVNKELNWIELNYSYLRDNAFTAVKEGVSRNYEKWFEINEQWQFL